jgi:ribosomal protein S18 acetylase RimI-like enzyme
MASLERPEFDTDEQERIYQYVERHGTAARHTVREVVSLSPDRFREQLAELTTKGYLEEDGGTIRLALDVGSVEEYETDEFTYHVRPARNDDFEGLIDAIRDATDGEEYVVAETVAEQLLYEDTVTRHNSVHSRVFFVAAVDGEIVGWTHLDMPQQEELQGTAQQTVGVKHDYRGRGVGSRLLQRGLDWAEANGYRKAYNSVPATNDEALAFLEAHDWDTQAIRREHYTIGDRTVDEVMMAYQI